MEQRLGVSERCVVDRRDVPDEVRARPEGKRNERVSQEPRDRQVRREPEDAERGRPLGEDDVLQQVDGE